LRHLLVVKFAKLGEVANLLDFSGLTIQPEAAFAFWNKVTAIPQAKDFISNYDYSHKPSGVSPFINFPNRSKTPSKIKFQTRLAPENKGDDEKSPISGLIALTNCTLWVFYDMSWKNYKEIKLLAGDLFLLDEDLWIECDGMLCTFYILYSRHQKVLDF
jgi:hypothetical protein